MQQLGPHPGPGDTLGDYTIDAPIGAGGMASVYRGRDPDGNPVALKVLNPARVLPEEVKRFTREYNALARMDHPNVVRVFGAGVQQGYPWIAMEYVDGSDLASLIAHWQTHDPADRFALVERLLRGMAAGLHYVHQLGLIHRDMKPSNVLVTRDLVPKLSDFGVVKDPDARGTQLTMAGRLVGTVAFMAPELISGENVDRRADLYALGAVLYVMLTFRRPIEASSVTGYLARHLTEVPIPPGEVNPAVPARLEHVCQRLLFKDASHRYATAHALLAALDRPDGPEKPPMRGRDALLNSWDARLQTLAEGAGGVLALVGCEGSGRSTLLTAFVEHARGAGVRVAHAGHSDPLAELFGAPEWGDLRDGMLVSEPTVLAVDDLDRVQAHQVDALARLVRQQVTLQGAPLLLLFSASELDHVLAPLMSGDATDLLPERHDLPALSVRAIVAMVRDQGLSGPVAPVLGRRLHGLFFGRPGWVKLQLQTLIDHGWLSRRPDAALDPQHSLDSFRHHDLPVPAELRASLLLRLDGLDPVARELIEVLALLGRPASMALVSRCSADTQLAAAALDSLVSSGLLFSESSETQETLNLAEPCAAAVLCSQLSAAQRQQRHATIASALGTRRRRSHSAAELARHLELSGQAAAAYPLFIQAARRAARAKQHGEVLDNVARAERIRQAGTLQLDAAESIRLQRWLHLLHGESLAARGRWSDALAPLEDAVAAARREGDRAALGRCLGALGRAHYRGGHFETAEPLLRQAIQTAGQGAPVVASATRALADIQLRRGEIEAADGLWNEALDLAIDAASEEDEARARRGLAHTRVLAGRLVEAAGLLDRADELLSIGGDPRVRAGVLARSIELDLAAGRFGLASHRADTLADLARVRDLSERLPEAYALKACIGWSSGDWQEAEGEARMALRFARANGPTAWDARLRAARVFADLGLWDEAEDALPTPEHLPDRRVDADKAQFAALRGRIVAENNRATGADLAVWAVVQPPALLGIRTAAVMRDAALALASAGRVAHARDAAKRGLKVLQGTGTDALRLELMLALNRAAADARVVAAIGQLARRLVSGLPAQAAKTFANRPGIAEALAGG